MKKKTKDIVHEEEDFLIPENPVVLPTLNPALKSTYSIGDSITGEHISGIKVFGEIQAVRNRDGHTQYEILRGGRYYWCFPVSESSVSFTEWGLVVH